MVNQGFAAGRIEKQEQAGLGTSLGQLGLQWQLESATVRPCPGELCEQPVLGPGGGQRTPSTGRGWPAGGNSGRLQEAGASRVTATADHHWRRPAGLLLASTSRLAAARAARGTLASAAPAAAESRSWESAAPKGWADIHPVSHQWDRDLAGRGHAQRDRDQRPASSSLARHRTRAAQ